MKKNKEDKKPIIGIIGGTGKFGGWFQGFFKSQDLEVLICGKKTELTPCELAKKCDIVIVSVPIPEAVGVIREVRDFVRSDALLCDFTSLKELTMAEMLKAKCGVTGIHPLFGPLVPSMKNQIIVFCSGRDNRWTKFLKVLFLKNGASVIFVDAKKHDQQMAMVQALTHFLNISFIKTLHSQKIKPLNVYSTPVFRLQSILAGRIFGGDPELYADLEMQNPAFLSVLDDYINQIKRLAGFVRNRQKNEFVGEIKKSVHAMRDFIPVAQTKAIELMSLLDRQPVEINKEIQPVGKKTADGAIGYLGPEGTFSHQAVTNVFSSKSSQIAYPTISRVFEAVFNGFAAIGMVPIENSSEGLIGETMDNLIKSPLKIIGSYNLPVHLCLLARTTDIGKIKIIKSHPQPIAQSRNWVSKNFPQAKLETESSSVKAILSTKDPSVAFIASRQAAKKYGLNILNENIEDKKTNITQFYVLSKDTNEAVSKVLRPSRTLLLLAVFDRPGILRDILDHFADQKINLSKLHSRVSEAEGWDYYFFLEVEALPDETRFKEALKKIAKHCTVVRILGIT